jgi:hypothetical protein
MAGIVDCFIPVGCFSYPFGMLRMQPVVKINAYAHLLAEQCQEDDRKTFYEKPVFLHRVAKIEICNIISNTEGKVYNNFNTTRIATFFMAFRAKKLMINNA